MRPTTSSTPALARDPARPRLRSIDLLRGLIMALMALDHTRAFILGFERVPTDLDTTTAALFATRWITHFCAPGFLLLAGAAAFLQRGRRGAGGLAVLLLTRGAFLVALELTVASFAWIPDPSRSLLLLQVIWAIGWSMILLAPLVVLPALWVGLVGVALALLHPALSEALATAGAPEWLRVLLLDANATLGWGEGGALLVSYPILPWFAVMAAGYGLGAVIRARPDDWPRPIAWVGGGLVLGFVVLRAVGLGLDPVPWQADAGAARAAMSFLNTEKYPPSPLFLMMTLGPVLLLLALLDRRPAGPWAGPLEAFGQAPLFFYVLHLYALRVVGLGAALAVWGIGELGPPPKHSAPEWSLWAAWGIWIAAMWAFYCPTRWFAGLKPRSRAWWMSYL